MRQGWGSSKLIYLVRSVAYAKIVAGGLSRQTGAPCGAVVPPGYSQAQPMASTRSVDLGYLTQYNGDVNCSFGICGAVPAMAAAVDPTLTANPAAGAPTVHELLCQQVVPISVWADTLRAE